MLNLTNGETSIGTSDTATSVFLSIAVFDRNLLLSWTANTPWTNRQYIIYRYNEQTADFDSIAIVSDTCYLDMNLDYDSNYYYKILAMGYYPDSSIIAPLCNYSQIVCATILKLFVRHHLTIKLLVALLWKEIPIVRISIYIGLLTLVQIPIFNNLIFIISQTPTLNTKKLIQ